MAYFDLLNRESLHMVEITRTLTPRSREQWRKWLLRNHRKKREIWLILYNKASGKQRFTISMAVEEALCYGWIDGILKKKDSERFALRFTPRRKRSVWSPHNVERVLELTKKGRMRKAGFDILPEGLLRKVNRLRSRKE